MAKFDVAEWLGAEAGEEKLKNTPNCIKILIAGYNAIPAVWEQDDAQDDALDEDKLGALCRLFSTYYEDSADVLSKTDKSTSTRKSDKEKLTSWLKAKLTSSKEDAQQKLLSPKQIEDMGKQGAVEPEQLGVVELAWALRSPPAMDEAKNYVYGAKWQSWCPKAVWNRKGDDFDSKLAACIEAGDVVPIDEWMSVMTEEMIGHEDPFIHLTGTRFLALWARVSSELKAPPLRLHYLKLLRAECRGRGLPYSDRSMIDQALLSKAMAAAVSGSLGSPAAPRQIALGKVGEKAASDAASTASGISAYTGLTSASARTEGAAPAPQTAEPFHTQMAELLAGMREMRSSIDGVRSSVETVDRKVEAAKAQTATMAGRVAALEKGPSKNQPCFNCGSHDHKISDCLEDREFKRLNPEKFASNKAKGPSPK